MCTFPPLRIEAGLKLGDACHTSPSRSVQMRVTHAVAAVLMLQASVFLNTVHM